MTDANAGTGDGNPNGAAAAVLNGDAGQTPAPFYDSFQDAGAKEWAQKSGYKSAEDLAKHAQKFDAFKDVDPAQLRALPKDGDPNAFVSFAQEHLGAPKEASAYGLDKLEGVDPTLAGAAQGWFAEAGLTPFQAQHIAAKQMEFMKAQTAAELKEEEIAGTRELSQLQTEWGSEYTAKVETGRRALKFAAQKLGLDANATTEFVRYLETGTGAGNALKIAALFGSMIKEGEFIDGGTGNPAPRNMAESWYQD